MGKPTKFSDISILLVEPSSSQHLFIRRQLESFGIVDLRWAVNGKRAAFEIRDRVPHLLISSMHLTDTTGKDLLLTIREIPQWGNIPFLLMTSETEERYLEPIKQAGALAILSKPFEPSDLRHALNATLDIFDPELIELPDKELSNTHVLIVDDSPTARKHIKKVLSSLGFQNFCEAENGEQGIEFLQRDHFDLIVTDYHMPRLNGHGFLTFIRNFSEKTATPVIMISSKMDQQMITSIEQHHMTAYCDKPFLPDTVRNLIMQLVVEPRYHT